MRPLIFNTEAFLRARVVKQLQLPAQVADIVTLWWRREVPMYGVTWHLCTPDYWRSGPAVVDDFGELVLVKAER